MKKMSRLMAFAIVGIVGTSTIQALTVKERAQQAKEWAARHKKALIGAGVAAAGLGAAGTAAYLSRRSQAPLAPQASFTIPGEKAFRGGGSARLAPQQERARYAQLAKETNQELLQKLYTLQSQGVPDWVAEFKVFTEMRIPVTKGVQEIDERGLKILKQHTTPAEEAAIREYYGWN